MTIGGITASDEQIADAGLNIYAATEAPVRASDVAISVFGVTKVDLGGRNRDLINQILKDRGIPFWKRGAASRQKTVCAIKPPLKPSYLLEKTYSQSSSDIKAILGMIESRIGSDLSMAIDVLAYTLNKPKSRV